MLAAPQSLPTTSPRLCPSRAYRTPSTYRSLSAHRTEACSRWIILRRERRRLVLLPFAPITGALGGLRIVRCLTRLLELVGTGRTAGTGEEEEGQQRPPHAHSLGKWLDGLGIHNVIPCVSLRAQRVNLTPLSHVAATSLATCANVLLPVVLSW
jgi:hypothetical protein